MDAQADLNLYDLNTFSHDVALMIPNMVTFRKVNPNVTLGGGFKTGGQCVIFRLS